MKKTIKAILWIIVIIVVTIVLGVIGAKFDQQMFSNRPEDVIGHAIPVYTMILPMLWLGILLCIGIVRFIRWIIRTIIKI